MVFMGTTFHDRKIVDLGRHLETSFALNFLGTSVSLRYAEGKPDAPVMLKVDGISYAMLAINARPDITQFQASPVKGVAWPNGVDGLQASSSYVMILPFDRPGEGGFLEKARGITMILAANCELPGVLGCHWGMSGCMHSPSELVVAGLNAFHRRWPMHIWSRISDVMSGEAATALVTRPVQSADIELHSDRTSGWRSTLAKAN